MNYTSNIAIIGGGAAGFFAAITAKEHYPNSRVVIYEKSNKVLSKVKISGGGRCNLTNSFQEIKDLKAAYPRGEKLLKRLFKTFNYKDAYQWFEKHGVALTTQADQCVFPVSQSSQSIIDCLVGKAQKLGVEIKTNHRLQSFKQTDDLFFDLIFEQQKPLKAEKLIITTGGAPRYENFEYLAQLGHDIEHPVPSLFTLNIKDPSLRKMMGIVIEPVQLSIPSTKFKSVGALLLTHWGISGPATLKLSSYAARYMSEASYRVQLSINWINQTNMKDVESQILEKFQTNPKKQIASIHLFGLTSRIWKHIIERAGIDPEKRCEEVGKKMTNKLIEVLTNDIYQVEGKSAYREEFVTCGGVSLSSINLSTLESKVCPNLYFAGEVLDIDAITGGFNLQAAWTTGRVAGMLQNSPKKD